MAIPSRRNSRCYKGFDNDITNPLVMNDGQGFEKLSKSTTLDCNPQSTLAISPQMSMVKHIPIFKERRGSNASVLSCASLDSMAIKNRIQSSEMELQQLEMSFSNQIEKMSLKQELKYRVIMDINHCNFFIFILLTIITWMYFIK